MKFFRYFFFAIILAALAACSNIRYLPDGEQLYIGADVKIVSDSLKNSKKKILSTELKSLPRPKPNHSYLGIRPQLLAYHIAGSPKSTKGLRNWLKFKIGEPPVLMSSVNLQINQEILQNRMENRGYYHASVTSDTSSSNRRVKATYTAIPGFQYLIKEVEFTMDTSALGKAVMAASAKSILKPGEPYNLDVIKGERDRIEQALKEQGYYYFSSDYLLIKVDSTVGRRQVKLYMTIKPETPLLASTSFVIGDITVYPNFNLEQTLQDTVRSNAVLFEGFYVIDKDSTFKPSVFSRSMSFKTGQLYNRTAHNLSLTRLMTIGSFKLVTNRFEIKENAIQPTLNTFYYLTPLPRKSLRLELLGTTKSNNLTGSELSVSWRNRNTFRGAEQFMIRAYGSFEVQINGSQSGYNTYRLGAESSLSIPQFVVPFLHLSTKHGFVPRTKFTLGYEILNKPQLYGLQSFRALAGYVWKYNARIEHELNLVSINFVKPTNVTTLFTDSLNNNPILAKTIERQFIVGSTYSFTYSDQLEVTRRNNIFFNGNIDVAGNSLGLIQGANYKTGDTATIFKMRYAQYSKIDGDLRYYLKTGRDSKLVGRIMAGFGFPYGNSSELPFIKQYFAGGTNSIRAFRARSIGPGTYRQADTGVNNFLPDQSGDIKLEMNAEYRFKLFSVVDGAVFVDAGNVWLYNDSPDKPGAKFTSQFLKEMAVGTGIGLRFDLSFLILRTDLGFPVRKPWLTDGQRWVFNQIDFTSKVWRKDNLVFNLAIGYPF